MNMTQAAYQIDKNALGVTYETAALVGSRLRQAREMKRLSPSQVSARIKIRDRYIEAIEIGDWDVLPPGLNGRGLIRLYARELAVAIPEFEAFHHLQTVMIEKQSESLMASVSKKSKYNPAAEESAEVIRSISRSDFKKNSNYDSSYESTPSSFDESHSLPNQTSKAYTRPVFNQRNTSTTPASIVTPNIYEVLGLEVEHNKTSHAKPEYETREVIHTKSNLPNAEPIKRNYSEVVSVPAAALEQEIKPSHVVVHQESSEVFQQIKKEVPFSFHKEPKKEAEPKKKLFELNPLQVVVVLGVAMVFIFVSLFLFSKNSNQIKETNLSAKQIESDIGESEPLSNSLVNSNIPATTKDAKAAEYPPQTQTVAEKGKNENASSPQKVSNVLEVERIAKLNIISKVNLTIEADGQQIFSGIHGSGVLDVPFKNNAEIVISDASKVNLIYEGIDHGALGYAGRKRKIILNARPYVE
ncbi:helix-turn-helix domain-containing protein [Silvanigrella aquatica]|uniref:DUF4115 domain-containing protein n=1 Tax=Silvanigrella aquatica TaxID=1915309 RepID=A0A1L4CXA3_9BACT|nr:helix-turn-helix transcriptional regulator [Silvanigrella aquatica]APJ02581.1 hypothetical protein AXG55_00980 [Silvanigrella aquatica]